MTAAPDVAAIAAGLTKPQRERVLSGFYCGQEVRWIGIGPTAVGLRKLGLATIRTLTHDVATSLGLAVCAHLLKGNSDER